MTLTGLYLYPIKSSAPLPVTQAEVEPRGLRNDRRWMVVDADGRFLTGRELPRMTLIRARPLADGLSLEAPGVPPLHVPVSGHGDTLMVTVWKSDLVARTAGATADAWLSGFLQRPVRLVHMDADVRRAITSSHALPSDEVSFADSFPLLLISRASLDGLNARLAIPVSMLQFRPNLVVDGVDAHAEDRWSRIRIGGVDFDMAKACVRCVFTTVDPARGERDLSGEPLRTLIGYRRSADGVVFGRHLIPRARGTLHVGDPVVVRETRD